MIKLLLDQGLPRTAAALLRDVGWEVQHVGERDMARAADIEIIEVARKEVRVVVTLDADFHALLALSGAEMPSVLRIRMEGLKADQVASLIKRVFVIAGDELALGALITVSGEKLRIKRLPITR